jgi:hypothetical protein
MLGRRDPETPLDTRRLSEFFAEPKNSHAARNVTGSRRPHWLPHEPPGSVGRCVRRAMG